MTTTDKKKTESSEEAAARILLDLLHDVGIGPNNLILVPERMPFRIGAEAVQEAMDIELRQRDPKAEGKMAFYAVFNKAQAGRIFPDGLKNKMCENGWAIMQAVLDLCREKQQVTIEDVEFCGICEKIDGEVARQQEVREKLPVQLFGKPGEAEGGLATLLPYALEDAGLLPKDWAAKLNILWRRHPQVPIAVLINACAFLLGTTEFLYKHGDAKLQGMTISLDSEATGDGYVSVVKDGRVMVDGTRLLCGHALPNDLMSLFGGQAGRRAYNLEDLLQNLDRMAGSTDTSSQAAEDELNPESSDSPEGTAPDRPVENKHPAP